MPDVTFEVKFSQLVDSALKEKVPALLEYRVGFQIIDKNEEETKAVGVSVFVVQGLWLYIPIFFIDGDLKGSDLLYVKQNDIFVPARDNWITSFKEQGSVILGDSVFKGDDLGKGFDADSPDAVKLDDDNKIEYKIAGEDSFELGETVDAMRKRYMDVSFDFTEKLAGLGGDAQKIFATTLRKSPEFANSFFEFYTPESLQKMAGVLAMAAHKEAEEAEKEQEPKQIEIITDISDEKAKGLKDSEKKVLVRQGVFVEDERYNFSKIFHNRIDPGITENPGESGIYDVLMADGSWKACVVLFFNKMASDYGEIQTVGGGNTRGVTQDIAVIPMGSNKRYYCRQISDVFCKAPSNESLKQFKGVKGGITANAGSLIKALEKYKKGDGETCCCPCSSAEKALIANGVSLCYEVKLPYDLEVVNDTISVKSGYDNDQYDIEFTGEEGNLSLYGRRLFVPKDARVFLPASWDEDKKFNLGNVTQIYSKLVKEASLDSLTIHSSGDNAEIRVNDHSSGLLDKIASIRYLAEGVGLFAGQAQQLLKEAARKDNKQVTYLLKTAAPYDVAAYEGKAPFMGGPFAKSDQGVKETTSTVGGQKQENMLPEAVINKANTAASTGIKEVFDTAVLEGLVNIADLSELRKDYIKDMIKGMDRVGRMMFLFYWHNEEFEDRYGDEDMGKLEDTLKQVFVSIGDLVLFLKEKIAYAPDNSESVLGSLSEDVGETSTNEQGGI